MSNSDVAVAPVGLPTTAAVNRKPLYLIVLENNNGKSKIDENFISLDKPELLNGFVQAKGFFCDLSQVEISKNFSTILTDTNKELYVEMMFPWHRLKSIKNLVFKAK